MKRLRTALVVIFAATSTLLFVEVARQERSARQAEKRADDDASRINCWIHIADVSVEDDDSGTLLARHRKSGDVIGRCKRQPDGTFIVYHTTGGLHDPGDSINVAHNEEVGVFAASEVEVADTFMRLSRRQDLALAAELPKAE